MVQSGGVFLALLLVGCTGKILFLGAEFFKMDVVVCTVRLSSVYRAFKLLSGPQSLASSARRHSFI